MKRYINSALNSQILEIYTSKNQITVCFKVKNGKIYKSFFGQQIAYLVNIINSIVEKTGSIPVSQDVEQGIIRDVIGINKQDYRYLYEEPVYRQYKKLFEDKKRAINCNLNSILSENISKNLQLRKRFKEICELEPGNGVCNSLNYLIVLAELTNREDFKTLLGVDLQNEIYDLEIILLKLLPFLNTQNFRKRENHFTSDDYLVYKCYSKFSPTVEDISFPIDYTQFTYSLERVHPGYYIELQLRVIVEYKNDDYDCDCSHSMLIYKGNNKKYIFFDPNEGAIGFNSSNGDSCLAINELFEIIRILINKYSYYEYIYKDNSLPDGCMYLLI